MIGGMRMYKKISSFFMIAVVSIFVLSGCNFTVENSKKMREDRIEIYNSDNEKILETQDQKILDYISTLIGMSTEKMDEKNYKEFFKEMPEDAKVRYHYVFITEREDKEVSKVDFYVYENYPYMTMKGIPLIPEFTWELSEEDLEQLQHIEREISKE
jgi:hypothetical protein